MGFDKSDDHHFKGKKTGKIYLTTHRVMLLDNFFLDFQNSLSNHLLIHNLLIPIAYLFSGGLCEQRCQRQVTFTEYAISHSQGSGVGAACLWCQLHQWKVES